MNKKLALLLMGIALTISINKAHADTIDGLSVRDPAIVRTFKKTHPCPTPGPRFGTRSGACPNVVADHICALAVGGLDKVKNMQYQTIARGKKKDRVENTLKGKKRFCNKKNSTPERRVFNTRAQRDEALFIRRSKL